MKSKKFCIVQEGTGYVVGLVDGDKLYIDRDVFSDNILKAKIIPYRRREKTDG